MKSNEIKNLSDDELEKKHQHFNNLFKGVAAAFIIIILIGIGYSGYADAKGYEASYGMLPVLFILFAGLMAIFYFELSKLNQKSQKEKTGINHEIIAHFFLIFTIKFCFHKFGISSVL